MGRFAVKIEVANNRDVVQAELGQLKWSRVRRLTIDGVVDSGAAQLVLPQSVVKQLGLPLTGKVKVRYADHRTTMRDAVENVRIEIDGRHGVFTATVEPKRRSVLVGAIVLEALDYLVDCRHQRLVPRDPRFIVAEIE